MNNYLKRTFSPSTQLYLLFIFLFLGLIVAGFVSLAIKGNENTAGDIRSAQTISSVLMFLVPPLIICLLMQKSVITSYFSENIYATQLVLSVVIVFISIPFLEVLNTWNNTITFSGSFSGLQTYFDGTKAASVKMIKVLTDSHTIINLFLNILVMAVVPAVTEEFFFRGGIQKNLTKIISNYHFAIFWSAVIFSAFHLQWDGFFVRIIYGLFLGYVYYFSNNLILPMILHFSNNCRVVLMLYWGNADELISSELGEKASMQDFSVWYYILAFLSLIGCVLALWLINRARKSVMFWQ